MPYLAVSVDIGSTWTKGVLVDIDSGRPLSRSEAPTTIDDLSRGFELVWTPLAAAAAKNGARDIETFLSSSAKGGLRIAAIGIVPDLTLKAAKLAAASAGGKVVASYSYKLKSRDLERLAASAPDLILLAGGTDGGDETYVLANAAALASSPLDSAVVYAGNAAVREEVLGILRDSGKRAVGADNILPDLDRLDYEGARAAIAALFLERIVEGRGLSSVRARCSAEPRPTPAAVFDLVRILDEGGYPGTGTGFLVVDMGGATTDVYSAGEVFSGGANTVYRGIPEPRVKRSVEGDLGLRVSARQVLELGAGEAESVLGSNGTAELEAWVDAVTNETGRLPRTDRENEMDAFLAKTCIAEAVRRHAGTVQGVYTATGLVLVQTGKDLSRVGVAVGTGGALARPASAAVFRSALGKNARDGTGATQGQPRVLIPDGSTIRYFRDAEYLIPLAANLAARYPGTARELAIASLIEDAVTESSHDR